MLQFVHQDQRLNYALQGSGPPLVLLHGLSGSRVWWRRNLPTLKAHFSVYTVDLVGFGRSRLQRALSIAESADLLEAWLKHLGLERPRVIGHSMGAHIALHLAVRQPLAALVLVAASALVQGPWWPMMLRLPTAGWKGAWDFLPTLAWDALRAGPLNLWRATQAIVSDDPSEQLSHIACPTLLVWGELDVLIGQEMGERLASKIAGSRLVVIKGAGHNVMYDRAEQFNQTVLPFLLNPRGG